LHAPRPMLHAPRPMLHAPCLVISINHLINTFHFHIYTASPPQSQIYCRNHLPTRRLFLNIGINSLFVPKLKNILFILKHFD
ncbi:MAG TPA: hypothetical protein PLL66_01550, partial [Bacteroidales bacterium]|nr:hypothetical protein [Bacteroidales bacterium]